MRFAPTTAGSVQGEKDEILTEDGRHPLLPELLGHQQEDHAGQWTARTSKSFTIPTSRSSSRSRASSRASYGAARIVIEGTHRRIDERATVPEECRAGAVAEPRECSQRKPSSASSRRYSPTSSPQRAGMGQAGRSRRSRTTSAKNRRVEIKVYPAESPAAAVDGDPSTGSGRPSNVEGRLRWAPLFLPVVSAHRRSSALLLGVGGIAAGRPDLVDCQQAGADPEDRPVSPVILPSPREVLVQLSEPAERKRAGAEHRGHAPSAF